FDDPVSSLDSDVLFIVSSLIRRVCQDIKAGSGHIKQVLILTHNIFFHKEVSFNAEKEGWNPSYSVIKKHDTTSLIERHTKNPISTSYELLWSEIKNQASSNSVLPNAMR